MSGNLSREKGLIFRILHLDNVPWIIANGMHCRNSDINDPGFVTIGNPDLIDSRHSRRVPCDPFGTLSDYVPFYFTPFTPMLLNITTGFNGVRQRPRDEIVIFVSSLPNLIAKGVPFPFTGRHANLAAAQFSSELGMLDRIDWAILRSRDFKRDPEDPGKFERYQAEALIYKYLPIDGVLGVICANDAVAAAVKKVTSSCSHQLRIVARTGY